MASAQAKSYEPPDPNDRSWQKFLASRVEEKHLAAKERNGGRPVKPPFGVTVIIGEMGCGKNLVATEFCARNYMRGVEVYSTSSAGMRFGKKLDISRGAKDIYAFGKSIKAAILLIDELQLYFNKMRQSNTSAVYFVESLAGLRKQGIHVLITAQDDNQLAGSVKRAVTTALFPQPMAYLPRVSRFGKRLAPTRRRGRRKWALLKVETLEGRRALWFGDPPNALQMVRGRQPPMPVRFADKRGYAAPVHQSQTYQSNGGATKWLEHLRSISSSHKVMSHLCGFTDFPQILTAYPLLR